MISIIWLLIIIFSLLYGLLTDVVLINDLILNVSYNSLDTFFEIGCGIVLWSGILEVAKTSGFLNFCTKKINVLTKLIFKTKDKETLSLISTNIICNFLGLSTMATPFGLEAASNLKKENNGDLNILLIMNYIGVSLLPISMLTLRNSFESIYTLQIIPYILIIGVFNTILGIALVRLVKCFT